MAATYLSKRDLIRSNQHILPDWIAYVKNRNISDKELGKIFQSMYAAMQTYRPQTANVAGAVVDYAMDKVSTAGERALVTTGNQGDYGGLGSA